MMDMYHPVKPNVSEPFVTSVDVMEGDYYNYDYNYTYDAAIAHLPLQEFVPVATIYTLIGLVGVVGNLLVIFAIARVKRMRSITNLFLLSLASADLLLVVVCVPVKVSGEFLFLLSLASADLLLVVVCVPVKGIAFYSYTWRLGEFTCRFVNYIQTVSMICSAFTLTVMSIERFVAIRHPLKARSVCTIRHARIVIVAVWTASFMAAVPMIFAIEYRVVGSRTTAHWCHKYWLERPTFGKVFELYMLHIILVIPVSVMLVTYTWIANIIWHVASHRAGMRSGSCVSSVSSERTTSITPAVETHLLKPPPAMAVRDRSLTTKPYHDDDKVRKQVVLMLIVVVVLFAVCWTPILINNVLVAFSHLDYLAEGYLKPMRMAFHILSYANSCVNPFVYAFMSKNFRDGFRQSLYGFIRVPAQSRRQQMSARSVSSTTRAFVSDKTNNPRCESISLLRTNETDDSEIRRV